MQVFLAFALIIVQKKWCDKHHSLDKFGGKGRGFYRIYQRFLWEIFPMTSDVGLCGWEKEEA
jgi:hypothetical protein